MLRIVFFGRLRDAAGVTQLDVALPDGVADTAALRSWLGRDNPALRDQLDRPSSRIIVNQHAVHGSVALYGKEDVAIISPVRTE